VSRFVAGLFDAVALAVEAASPAVRVASGVRAREAVALWLADSAQRSALGEVGSAEHGDGSREGGDADATTPDTLSRPRLRRRVRGAHRRARAGGGRPPRGLCRWGCFVGGEDPDEDEQWYGERT
jgi:hypothetical protein